MEKYVNHSFAEVQADYDSFTTAMKKINPGYQARQLQAFRVRLEKQRQAVAPEAVKTSLPSVRSRNNDDALRQAVADAPTAKLKTLVEVARKMYTVPRPFLRSRIQTLKEEAEAFARLGDDATLRADRGSGWDDDEVDYELGDDGTTAGGPHQITSGVGATSAKMDSTGVSATSVKGDSTGVRVHGTPGEMTAPVSQPPDTRSPQSTSPLFTERNEDETQRERALAGGIDVRLSEDSTEQEEW